jgi:hypothetical protein
MRCPQRKDDCGPQLTAIMRYLFFAFFCHRARVVSPSVPTDVLNQALPLYFTETIKNENITIENKNAKISRNNQQKGTSGAK